MAKAHHAPSPRGKLHRSVTDHAIERLRERSLPDHMQHRPKFDLARWLDDAVEDAIKRGVALTVTDFEDNISTLVDVTENLQIAPTHAIVRPSRKSHSIHDEVIVTVLNEEQAERLRKRAVGELGQKLRAAVQRQAAAKPVPEKQRESQPPPIEMPNCKVCGCYPCIRTCPTTASQGPQPPASPTPSLMVSYVGDDGPVYEGPMGPRRLRYRLQELALDDLVDADTIRVWREVPTRIEVTIDIEL